MLPRGGGGRAERAPSGEHAGRPALLSFFRTYVLARCEGLRSNGPAVSLHILTRRFAVTRSKLMRCVACFACREGASMPNSISSFVSRSFSWLSTGGLRPADPHVEQSTASQQRSGAGQATAAASSAAPLPEVVMPLGHLDSLPAPYAAPFAFAGPNVVPPVNEAADAVEQAAAAAALCAWFLRGVLTRAAASRGHGSRTSTTLRAS